MTKFIVCIETEEEELFPEYYLVDGEFKCTITKSFAKVDSEEQFESAWAYGENAITERQEFNEDVQFGFYQIVKTFMDNGILSGEGKLTLEQYNKASYLAFAIETSEQLFAEFKEKQAQELKKLDFAKDEVKRLKSLIKLELDEGTREELEFTLNEHLEFIGRDRISGVQRSLINMGVSSLLSIARKVLSSFDTPTIKFYFDYKTLLNGYKPLGEKLAKWVLKSLKNDAQFNTLMSNFDTTKQISDGTEYNGTITAGSPE